MSNRIQKTPERASREMIATHTQGAGDSLSGRGRACGRALNQATCSSSFTRLAISAFSLILAALLTSCTDEAEPVVRSPKLSLRAPVYGDPFGSDETNLLFADNAVGSFTVRDAWAYWFALKTSKESQGVYQSVLRSCDTANCEKTLQSLVIESTQDTIVEPFFLRNDDSIGSTPILMAAGATHVYWSRRRASAGTFLEFCKARSCSKRNTIPLGTTSATALLMDGSHLLVATDEGTLLRCDEANCENTLESITLLAPDSEPCSGGLSQLAADDSFYYALQDGCRRIIRLSKDKRGPYEVVSDVEADISQFAVFDGSVYWVQRYPARAKHCPVASCKDGVSDVTTQLHAPQSISVDATGVYIVEPGELEFIRKSASFVPGSNRMLRCINSECEPYAATESTKQAGAIPFVTVLGDISKDKNSVYYRFTSEREEPGLDSYSVQGIARWQVSDN